MTIKRIFTALAAVASIATPAAADEVVNGAEVFCTVRSYAVVRGMEANARREGSDGIYLAVGIGISDAARMMELPYEVRQYMIGLSDSIASDVIGDDPQVSRGLLDRYTARGVASAIRDTCMMQLLEGDR